MDKKKDDEAGELKKARPPSLLRRLGGIAK